MSRTSYVYNTPLCFIAFAAAILRRNPGAQIHPIRINTSVSNYTMQLKRGLTFHISSLDIAIVVRYL